jgi:signal transduction histidine kinase/ActR/RegA family two-component response regulator
VSEQRVSAPQDADRLRAFAMLAEPHGRADAARLLAEMFRASGLILFARDPVSGRSLPVDGFPQTLPEGRVWRDLLATAMKEGEASGTVAIPGGGSASARAIATADGTALVLLDPRDPSVAPAEVLTLLPLFGALARCEAALRRAETQERLARQSATESAELATKLDLTRTELQRALATAERATRARDEFLATVSHELRTPLTSIIGWIQILQGETDAGILAEAHETIGRNARAQSRLIEDILDFSRIHAGKLRLDVQPIDLLDVINGAIDVVRPAADAKGVRLDAVLDPNAGHVSGDTDRLQQVVWNLLSNAVKFTSRDGKVQVRLERVNSHSEITVSDTGEGIDPEFLPYVFDRFSQADSGSTRMYGGLGLGLGIVKHLVELHGGTVNAYSPGRGRGATFVVCLPRLIARDHAAHDLREQQEQQVFSDTRPGVSPRLDARQLSGIRALVVEDNNDARLLLATILRRSGAIVDAAASAASALDSLLKHRPDIIISDIEMPGEDGYSLIRRIRSNGGAARNVPAIALTAYARTADRVRALGAGFQMHIPKPVEPSELVAAVKSLVAATRHDDGPSY